MIKYFLYARKSTDDEERQVLSIESQLDELRDYAKKENIYITDKFIESKTAKQPGRPIFNSMLAKIENDEADGILAWNPDRLARNAVDGGKIIHLIDRGKLKAMKFPTYWFEPSSQGLFMLQIAFGQAKYYIDNLSENVKRGHRQKLRRGEYPGNAPLGYVNNLKYHTIEIDTDRAPKIKKLFEEYAIGKYTLHSLQKLSLSLGLVSQIAKGPLSHSVIQHLLKNIFYIGLFNFNGETYEGKHKPIISKKLFNQVQNVMREKSRPRKTKVPHNFPFRGLFKCGECGMAVTAERHTKKSGLVFRYYRCTKKGTTCSQKYISEKELLNQINENIINTSLTAKLYEPMQEQINKWKNEDIHSSTLAAADLKKKLEQTEKQLSRLLSAHLEGIIEADEYQNKKRELLSEKTGIKQQLTKISRRGHRWLEPLEEWIKQAHQAHFITNQKNLQAKAEHIRKIGSNRLLLSGKAAIVCENPWKILTENSRCSDWREH